MYKNANPWRGGLRCLALALSLASGKPTYGVQSSPEKIGPLGPPGIPASLFPKLDRPVAGIVAEEWSTEDARDRDGEADQVMDVLGVGPGMTVADIGAGSGYYTIRRRIGPTGQVIAQYVVPQTLETFRVRVETEGLHNVVFDLGDPHDPRLTPHSVDLALMVHMYHEVEQPRPDDRLAAGRGRAVDGFQNYSPAFSPRATLASIICIR
jgi:hypothetical protein